MAVTVTQQSKIWNQILVLIEKELQKDKHSYDAFFSESKLLEMDDNSMLIGTVSVLCQRYLSSPNAHLTLLKNSIKKVTGKEYKLTFVVTEDYKNKQKENTDQKVINTPTNYTFFTNCKINPKYTFDNFVVGECNKEAVRASIMVSNNPGFTFNPLFIYSKSGLGKTHLLHAIGNYYQEKYPSARVLYITTDSFIDEFVRYVTGSQENQSLKDFFNTVDLLLVDDIQFLSDKTKTAEMFFYIFNALVNNGKQVVLTSDRHPKDLKGLEDRLVSRFNMGLSEKMHNPDTETLLEILKRKIVSHGLNLANYDEDGLVFLAETFSRNVRELEGALNRLLFHTVSIKGTERITVDDIKESVQIMLPNSAKLAKNLTENDIVESVASYYQMTAEQIYSKIRTAQIALARRICMYLCRTMLGSSYIKIGEVFKRDHSTVMTAVEKVGKEIKTDSQLATAIQDIKKSLKK